MPGARTTPRRKLEAPMSTLLKRPVAALAGVILGAVLLPTCSRGPAPVEVPPVQRLIPDDPQARFTRSELFEAREVFRWSFQEAAELASWQANVPRSELSPSKEGLQIDPSRRFVTLTRAVRLEAAEVDGFEITIQGAARQPISVAWARSSRPFTATREVKTELGAPVAGGARRHRLLLRGHPHWRGSIERLRFALVVPPGGRALLSEITAITESVPNGRLDECLGRPWKVALGDDLRNARLAHPARPIDFSPEISRGSRLSWSFGMLGSGNRPVRYGVVALDGAGARRTLYEGSLGVGEDSWRDGSVRIDDPDVAAGGLRLVVELEEAFDPRAGLPAWANVELLGPDSAARPNVVLVSIDTLRPDHLSLYGYDRETSPRLDRWARRHATVFRQAIAAAPWTLPSHVSMFTGIDAHRHGVNFNVGAPHSLETMAERLREAGYATIAVTGGGFVHSQYGFAQGFDRYHSFSVRMGLENELDVGIERALEAVEALADRPFFLFFHTYAVHNPFRPRGDFTQRFGNIQDDVLVDVRLLPSESEDGFRTRRALYARAGDEELDLPEPELMRLAVDLYDVGIAYADDALGRLLDRLQRQDLAARTLVVVTSDHGELFGEHGLVNHISLYDENLRVPLVIATPDRTGSGRIIDEPVRLIDLLPTVLEIVGLPIPDQIDGTSFASAIGGHGPAVGPHGLAFSYAAASNYGISARDGAARHYILRNDAWISAGPREELLEPAVDGEVDADPGGSEALERLRAAVSQELATALPGMRIRFLNSGAETWKVRLLGSLVQPARMKVLGLRHGGLERTAGGARLEVRPGVDLTLVVEGLEDEPVTVDLEGPRSGAAGIAFEYRPSALAGVERISWSQERGWQAERAEAGRPPDDGIYVWWTGAPPAPGDTTPTRPDAELLEQLEALGYLDG